MAKELRNKFRALGRALDALAAKKNLEAERQTDVAVDIMLRLGELEAEKRQLEASAPLLVGIERQRGQLAQARPARQQQQQQQQATPPPEQQQQQASSPSEQQQPPPLGERLELPQARPAQQQQQQQPFQLPASNRLRCLVFLIRMAGPAVCTICSQTSAPPAKVATGPPHRRGCHCSRVGHSLHGSSQWQRAASGLRSLPTARTARQRRAKGRPPGSRP